MDVADPNVELCQQRFVSLGLQRLVERDTLKLLAAESAHEQIPLPFGNPIAGVKRQAGGADRRHPIHHRHFHARSIPRLLRRLVARIDLPQRYDRPAVIAAGEQHVELVAPERPNLARPQGACLRMPRKAKNIPVAIGINFRLRARAAHEWVVRRHTAIVTQPQDLADVTAEILGAHPEARVVADDVSVAVADCHVDHAVWAKLAATRNRTTRFPGVGYEEVAKVAQRRAVEPTTREGERGALVAFLLV